MDAADLDATVVPRWMRQLELAMLVATVASVPVTLALIDGVDGPWLIVLDWILWTIFAVEFAAPFFLDRRTKEAERRDPKGPTAERSPRSH